MTLPSLTAWPPAAGICALPMPGIPFMPVPELCPRHRPPAAIGAIPFGQLMLVVLGTFSELPDVVAECGGDPARFAHAARLAAPLCCALGDEAMEKIARQIPGVWALRS